MTRKQAAKIADEIVRIAQKSSGSVNWRTLDITVSPAILRAIDEDGQRIVGCLPMGWRITGKRGDDTLTVVRHG